MSALMFLAHSCLMGEATVPEVCSFSCVVSFQYLMGICLQAAEATVVSQVTTPSVSTNEISTQEITPSVSSNEISTQTVIVGSKRATNTIITPFCLDPSHSVSFKASMQRQRHTCFKCFRGDWRLLKSNPFITPWQLSCVLGSMTRQYACNLCVLEKAGEADVTKNLPRPTLCKKHSVFFRQTMCTKHDRPWTRCDVCLHDPRAATSCCIFCGKIGSRACGCPRGPIAMRDAVIKTACKLPDGQVKLMEQLTTDVLEYAKQLQETQGIIDPMMREAKINEIKTIFQFQDTKNLHRFYSLDVMELTSDSEERVAICALCS